MPSRKDLANAIRMLSIDSIQKAQSGHPGAPMGMADIAEVLWRDYFKHNPVNPHWPDRDRFVLSNGHSSMLIYSLLHLTGYNLSINDLQNFRQLNSKTPGHPEYGCTLGIEVTTGPLGQGIANAVGFAIAERTLATQFNRFNYDIVNHYTYAFMGDGCMMEGISHEACSLAGTLKLNKLIVFYDDNGISIDGNTNGWFTEDITKRFESYGWHVLSNIDGHEFSAIKKAIEQAQIINKPSLIICKTIIGFGSPNKSGSHHSHGAPLGEDEVFLTRKQLGWHHDAFVIPPEIYDKWNAKKQGQQTEKEWNKKFREYEKIYPQLAAEFQRRISNKLPQNWYNISTELIQELQCNSNNISTRQASQKIIETLGKVLPEFLGGSADLAPSNLSMWSGSESLHINKSGNYIHYGVREFGMTAIANGIALHGGFLPYTATFLIFSEYARNAVRMAALMGIRHIMIYTHDSIGLGEDGPTHQPIEQLANLRNTPNLSTWRPCDQVESAVAWIYAIERGDGPSALIFSRQNLIQQERNSTQLLNINRGGYLLKECFGIPQLILIATGSEVSLAITVWKKLCAQGYRINVVSMPSVDVFEQQNADYRESVLPSSVRARIAIEAGISDYWFKYVGLDGAIIGMNTFGESGPAPELFKKFGFTVDNIIDVAQSVLAKNR